MNSNIVECIQRVQSSRLS